MGTREVSPRRRDGSATSAHALRVRWRTASLASGWPRPGDWSLAEVDTACAAILGGAEPAEAVVRLARARARAGSGLAETLQDVAALHAVLTAAGGRDGFVAADPDAMPARLLRVTALAWSEVLVHQLAHAEVRDGLTGLSSVAYLRARLREVYRQAAATGVGAGERHVLVVFAPDLGETSGWARLAAMVLLADVLGTVFDGGQTLAAVGPTTAVVLAERDDSLAERVAAARELAARRLGVDPQLRRIGAPPVWFEALPAGHDRACRLLGELARI